jgi:RimJ/RimL family protein N-acetyltransferase
LTGWPDALEVRSWTPADAQSVARWRYPGRWSVYDLEDGDSMSAAGGYRAVVAADDGRLIGFYCVGGEALVPGVEPDDEIVDLGVGMAPVFLGNGRGNAFLHAVLDDVGRQQPAKPVRALIQSWNVRSLSLARRFGFLENGIHRCVQDGEEIDYTVVVRPAHG